MNVVYKVFETSSDREKESDGVGLDIADFRAAAAELAKTAYSISEKFDLTYQLVEGLSEISGSPMKVVVQQSRSNLRRAIQSITAEMRHFAQIAK